MPTMPCHVMMWACFMYVVEDFIADTFLLFFPDNCVLGAQMCVSFVTIDDNVIELTEEFTVTALGANFFQDQDTIQVQIKDGES